MGALSLWHVLAIAAVLLLLFGRGRVSALLSDIGKGFGKWRSELRDSNISDANSVGSTSFSPVEPDALGKGRMREGPSLRVERQL